jgi:NAD(P)-dependent dehydrogenase (short-subunit alcohol dehydrogenase family)
MKQRGWNVFATARQAHDLKLLEMEGLNAVYLDYRHEKTVETAVKTVLEQTKGRLDAVFNNGAYGQPGALEDLPTKALREQFETNLFGWHALTREVIPIMRRQGQGRLVQCSSVLGFIALRYRGAYNASKFALEGWTDTLRLELEGTGIHVISIQPGPITSRFREHALTAFEKNIQINASPHRQAYVKRLEKMQSPEKDRFELGPEAVLEKLIKAVESKNPKPVYRVTVPTHAMAVAKHLLPKSLMHRLLLKVSDEDSKLPEKKPRITLYKNGK